MDRCDDACSPPRLYKVAAVRPPRSLPTIERADAEVAEAASFRVSVNRAPNTAHVEAFHHNDSLDLSDRGRDERVAVGRRPIRVGLTIEMPRRAINRASDVNPNPLSVPDSGVG
jgi:hypothetical protein